jgi:capsular exopolysaccharide synthesis family protein
MKKDASLPTRGAEATQDLQGTVAEDLLATHMQIISSPRIVRRALEQRKLESLPSILEQLEEDQEPIDYVIENLEVARGGEGAARGAHVLTASFRHTSPEDCAAVLNAIVESYQDFLGETFQDFGKEAVELIGQAKVELEADLEKSEEAYREFRENAPLLWRGAETYNVHQDRLSQFETGVAEVALRKTQTQSRLATIEEALSSSDPQELDDLELLSLLDDQHVARLGLVVSVQRGDGASEEFLSVQPARSETARAQYDRLLELKMEEKTLLMDLGPSHPRVRDVQESIRVMEDFLNANREDLGLPSDDAKQLNAVELVRAYQSLLRHDLEDLDRRDKELQQSADQERDAAQALVAYELSGETMRKQVERKQELYDAVIDRLREINLVKDYGGFITEVMSPVRLGQDVWPLASLVFGLGGVLGLFAGTATAFLVDAADSTFRNVEEVQHALQLPLLVQLPKLATNINGAAAESTIAPIVAAYHHPRSRQAEAFRSLRTTLYFGSHAATRKVIQVTSPSPGDGKTTATVNLAVALAQAGKRVLLIDADLRRPQIHSLFGIASEVGLSTVLVGETEVPDAICEMGIENLWIMPSGPIPQNPAELLSLPQFEQLLAVVKERYDYVLIDSPPLLAVSEPATIASRADGVLLVVRITKNGRPGAVHAREILNAQNANVIGVVLNDVDRPTQRAYGGYVYDDSYAPGADNYYREQEPTHS